MRTLEVRAPAPKAGGLRKTTLLSSTFPLKQKDLVKIIACGWLCANVPICLLGGHKSWHNLDGARSPASHTGTNSNGCRDLQPSESFSPTFPLPDGSRGGLNDQLLIPQRILGLRGQSGYMTLH